MVEKHNCNILIHQLYLNKYKHANISEVFYKIGFEIRISSITSLCLHHYLQHLPITVTQTHVSMVVSVILVAQTNEGLLVHVPMDSPEPIAI